jgi:integrase
LTKLLIQALECAWDPSTRKTYKSHLKSYLYFIRSHKLDVEPNETTLALYVVYMSQFIKPTSVESYLTGICHYLRGFYPNISNWRNAPLLLQTLRGCKKRYGTPVRRKKALSLNDLSTITVALRSSKEYDDVLFIALLLVGFFGLLRLGELVYPNDTSLDQPKKMVQRSNMQLHANSLRFELPYHKADRFFQGNTVLILPNNGPADPIAAVARYCVLRDKQFPEATDMWIRSKGERPRRSWFIRKLRAFEVGDVAGHSLRSGGATTLAENGVRLDIIQALGRWSSDAFRSYIRLHPIILHYAILRNK